MNDEDCCIKPKYELGRVIITRNAMDALGVCEVFAALARHASGDWGDLSAVDREENNYALLEGCRLFSVYHSQDGVPFWIITEADRSLTSVLLPDDY